MAEIKKYILEMEQQRQADEQRRNVEKESDE